MQGSIKSVPLVLAAFEFEFMGGSMGSVVGERFVRGVRVAYENRMPFVCISASGGARMQEGVNSLFQMAKTTAVLQELTKARLPFVSMLTDPTMGGVSASFAFVADVVIAEPGALIGFAGPRVIEQTVREKLPEGFQRAEFLLEKGAIDMIVDRRQLRDELPRLLALLRGSPRRRAERPTHVQTRPPATASLAPGESSDPMPAAGRHARRVARVPRDAASEGDRAGARARARGPRADGRGARLPGRHRRRHQRQGLDLRACSRRSCAPPATAPASTRRRICRATTSACASTAREADDDALVRAFDAVEDARRAGDVAADLFRVRHAGGALALRRAPKLDAAILEVGLGGRLDAVNIVDADVAVVTSIDLDHMDYLGPTREDIGREKAGIFRAGRPAVCADPIRRRRSSRTPRAIGAPLLLIGRDYGFAADEPRNGITGGPAAPRHGLPVSGAARRVPARQRGDRARGARPAARPRCR